MMTARALLVVSLLGSVAQAQPVPAVQQDLVRRTYRVLPHGKLVYLAATVGVVVADISDPAKPRHVGALLLPESVNDLALVQGKLVVALGPGGIVVADISRPVQPKRVAALRLAGAAMGLWPHGEQVLVASGTAGLQLVDLSRPDHPRKVGHRDTPGYARAVRTRGQTVYVADGARGVQVLRLQGNALRPLATVATRGHVFDLDVEGSALLVAEGHGGVSRHDVSDAARPRLTGHLAVRDTARGIDARGSHAAVADGTRGLMFVDIAGKQLRELGRFTPERSVNSAVLRSKIVLVANDYDGLLLLGVDREGKMTRLGSLPPTSKE